MFPQIRLIVLFHSLDIILSPFKFAHQGALWVTFDISARKQGLTLEIFMQSKEQFNHEKDLFCSLQLPTT